METTRRYTAFRGSARIASGELAEILPACHAARDGSPDGGRLLVFEDDTGRQVDFDLHGELPEVLTRHRVDDGATRRGPGRPRLGVRGMEVTLLPRHWEWLERQPQGISGTLRRLVDEARARETDADRDRARADAAYRFMSAIAGDLPGFEEACRALYRRDREVFGALVGLWPADIGAHALGMLGWDAPAGGGRPA